MKNLKKLTREQLRTVKGGKSCTLTFQNSNGSYTTYSGTCSYKTELIVDDNGHVWPTTTGSFCNIGNGVEYPLSSNGGTSRC